MDKSKDKDEMLAAGKKRLEQFRQKKQGKGSSTKQNKQETRVEHDSHKGSKHKNNAVVNDSEANQPRSSRMHISDDHRGSAKSKSRNGSKNFPHGVAIEKSSDKSSPRRTDCNSASDLDATDSFHTEASISEKSRVDEGVMPAIGNGEFTMTSDSSQLQPSSAPFFSSQLQESLEENHPDFTGRPDWNMNVADTGSLDLNSVQDGEMGMSEQNTLLNSLEASQASDQKSAAFDLLASRTPPCLSSNYRDLEAINSKSEYGDKMQRDDGLEGIIPSSSYPSPQVPPSLQLTRGQDKGETSWQSGHEFDSRTVAVVLSSHVSDVVDEAASNAEQAHSPESNEGTYVVTQSKTKPIVILDTELGRAVGPDVDCATVSQTPNMENVTDHSEGILRSDSNRSFSFNQPQTGELDVSRVNFNSALCSDSVVIDSTNGHGLEGSEFALMVPCHEKPRELPGVEVSHDPCDIVSNVTHDVRMASENLSVEPVVDVQADSQGDGHGVKGAEDTSLTSLHGFTMPLHGEDMSHKPDDSVSGAIDGRHVASETLPVKPLVEIQAELQCDGHGIEGGEYTSLTSGNGTIKLRSEDLSHNSGDSVSPTADCRHKLPETSSVNPDSQGNTHHIESSECASVTCVHENIKELQDEDISLTMDGGHKGSKLCSVNPLVDVLDDSQFVKNHELEHAEFDDGLKEAPPASSIIPERISVVADCVFHESRDSGCQDEIPVVQKESMQAETECPLQDGSLIVEEIQKTISEVSGQMGHDQTPQSLQLGNPFVHGLANMKILPGDPSCGEPSSEHEDSKTDTVLNQLSETSVPFRNLQENCIGFGNGSLPEPRLSNGVDQNTGEEDINTELIDVSVESLDLKTHCSSLDTPEEIVVLDAFDGTAQDLRNGSSILSSENHCGINQLDVEHSSNKGLQHVATELVAAADIQRFHVNEMALPSASVSASDILEKEERTDHLENEKPSSESSTAFIKCKELEGELHSYYTDSIEGSYYAKQEVAPSLNPEHDVASTELEKADVVAIDVQTKLEAERLFPHGAKEEQTQTTHVCSHQTDVEPNHAGSSQPSVIPDISSDSRKSFEGAGHLASSHVRVDEGSLFGIHSNEAASPSVTRRLPEDQNPSIGSYHSRTTRTADLPITEESERMNTSNLYAGTLQVGHDVQIMEGTESDLVIRQLKDALCIKGTELENMLASMNSEAAKHSEERDLFVKSIKHVVQRLSLLAQQGLIVNKNAESQFNLFGADTVGSFNFTQFAEDFNCWMDKIQENAEEKAELEVAKENLEKIQSIKNIEMNDLRKQLEDISQKYDDLQRDLDEEQHAKSSCSVLQELLAVKDADVERLSDLVSELTRKCDLTMNEVGNALEERVKMEGSIQQLEALLSDKETDSKRLCKDFLELSKKFDLAVLELATAEEDRSKMDGQAKQLKDLLSAKETELKQMSDESSELSHKCELALAEMGKLSEENGNVEAELRHFQNLYCEQANNIKCLEESLLVRNTELESLQDLNVEQERKICHVEDLLLVRNAELESAQKLYGAEREGHLSMLAQASALAEKIAKLLNSLTVNIDGDEISALEILVTSLCDQYEAILRQNNELTLKAIECNAAYDTELNTMKTDLSGKERELNHVQEQVDLLTKDREGHLIVLAQVNALSEKVSGLLKSPIETIDGDSIDMLENLVTSLHDQYEAIVTTNKDLAGRIIDCDTAYERDVNTFRANLIEKEVELGHLQEKIDLSTKEREGHLNMLMRITALAEKVAALLNSPAEAPDGDAIGMLEILVMLLHDQHESVIRKHNELTARTIDSDTEHDRELNALGACLSEREVELGQLQEKVELLTKELRQTKEDCERKLLESEQRGLGYRERLSLAVTKGKGLVQQRDNLKQQLAEKISELEALNLSYEQELHAKAVAINAAESKARINSEAGERVEALESELSYIRNSSNALRESFLQKDAVLQKIEELLDDVSFPEDLHIKDTYEKVEWLMEASNQQISTSAAGPRLSEVDASRGLDNFALAEQASQTHEIEQLNKKCDEYVRKYRSMAEELAMLEQSLLERNMLIQRWEEMLDVVDMPATIKGKEPEDKIKWLGTAIADAHNSIDQIQADMENLQITAENSHQSLQELQEQNSVLSAELAAKEEKLRTVALDLANMTPRSANIPKLSSESSDDNCRPAVGIEGSDLDENDQQGCQQLILSGNVATLIPEICGLLREVLQAGEVEKIFADSSLSTAFETSLKLLVDNSKLWLAEAHENSKKVSELSLALRNVEEDGERRVNSLREALGSKTLEVNSLVSQIEGFVAKITSLEDHVDHWQKEVDVKTEELFVMRDELNKSQLEASEEKEKHASTREKLSMAVRKGKSVLQQRDTHKQALDETVAELDQLKGGFESERMAFTKAKQSFKHQLLELEGELSSSRAYAVNLEKLLQENIKTIQKSGEALDKIDTSGASRSRDLVEKIQWVSQFVLDLQRKAGFNEQEAKKSKKATELLSLELEETQGKVDSLADDLMNAEKNISLLAEEKKLAENLKAEAGLRLEHAMANINSLLFEHRETKEAQAIVEQENNSLKDSLAAQTEEIRFMHKSAEEQVLGLHDKLHILRAKQSNILDRVANELFKSSENVKGIRSLIFRIAGEVEKHDVFTPLSTHVFDENLVSKWESQNLNRSKERTWGVTTDSLRLQWEEMEAEIQHFNMFLDNAAVALNQEFTTNHQMLSELHNGLDSFLKELENFKREANAVSTREALLQNNERVKVQEELFKTVAENLMSCVKDVEGLQDQSADSIPQSFSSHESWQNLAVSLAESLSSSVKNLTQSCHQACIESEKHNEELTSQLKEAKDAIHDMGQQQQKDKLEVMKYLEQMEAKDGILKRTKEELSSLRNILTAKKHEEEGRAAALEKAELKIGRLSAEVEELQKAKQELEASLAKASSRFHATINNFNKFQSLSEKLIEEAESLHLLLEDKDGQISLLKDEIAYKAKEMTDLQNLVNERTADLSQVYQHIGSIINKEVSNGEPLPDPGRRKEILEALSMSMRAGSESLRVQLARKDALLQDIQLRHDDLARKVHALESSVQESHRVMEGGAAEHMMITVEAEDKGTRGKHAAPSAALVTHGRAGRKAATDYSAVDIDTESAKLLADVDDEDKGHVFKPLTSSRLVPRGTRFLVDRLDGFWVSGERLLRRKPGARLSVILYWLVLHIWIVASLL